MSEIESGRRAALILADPVFQEALRAADERFIYQWRHATTAADRERAHALQAALSVVIQELETIVGRGDIAQSRQT
jgi:hypothetical protein